MPKSKYAERGKVKPKSIKSKAKLSSKRKLSRFGKKQKEGHAGVATTFITRTAAVKSLQLTLKDFRRLCILKGIYPRDPRRKTKGHHNTYYHYKDIQYLSHEPILNKFRENKAFMKKVKKAIGRNEVEEARRLYSHKPSYTLDHLVKERYPRFGDAIADLDDAISMVHMFATLPANDKAIDPQRTLLCQRLVKEWQAYIIKTRGLRKVFLSVKGVYFQAEVCGHNVTWLAPWQFPHILPKAVDYKVMGTFLQFHEVFLKFVFYKLYTQLGLTYPPTFSETLMKQGAMLSALQLQSSTPVTTTTTTTTSDAVRSSGKQQSKTSTTSNSKGSGGVTKLQDSLKAVLASKPGALADDDDEDDDASSDSDDGGDDKDMDDDGTPEGKAAQAALKQKRLQQRLFKGLTFFLSREVPRDLFEFVVKCFGGRVGWDGEGSPFDVNYAGITHVVIDRPSVPSQLPGREYVQPQWVIDSLNTIMLLPVKRYAPGADLPPHLSPFVDDTARGYMPRYREQLEQLKTAASVTGKRAALTNDGDDVREEALEDEPSDAEDDDEDDDDSSDDSEDDDDDLEEKYAKKTSARGKTAFDGNSDDEDDEDDESEGEAEAEAVKPQAASAAVVKKRKAVEMQLEHEQRKMAESMLTSKKAKQYKVVMNARAKAAAEVEKLKSRRDAYEAKSKAGNNNNNNRYQGGGAGKGKQQQQQIGKVNGGAGDGKRRKHN